MMFKTLWTNSRIHAYVLFVARERERWLFERVRMYQAMMDLKWS